MTVESNNLPIDYAEIKRWLEHGDIKKIAKDHNIDPTHAGKMLDGKVNKLRFDFIAAVIERSTANKRKINELMNKHKQA